MKPDVFFLFFPQIQVDPLCGKKAEREVLIICYNQEGILHPNWQSFYCVF